MTFPTNKTLGNLATELSARLGFSAQGTPTLTGNPMMFYLLQDAQEQLITHFSDTLLRVVNEDESTTASVKLLDIPNDCDPNKIISIAVKIGSIWHELTHGIKYYHESLTSESYPLRYDIRYEGGTGHPPSPEVRVGQLEFWPVPQSVYPLRIEYYRRVQEFTDPTHECTVNDRLVFLHALANGKAHYQRSDAQVYGAQLDAMMRKLKSQQYGNKRFIFGKKSNDLTEFDIPPDFDTQAV